MKKYLLITLVIFCSFARPLAAQEHAFLWSKTTGMQDLGTLGDGDSYATAVNDVGQVVGYNVFSDGISHAFLWTATEGIKDLGVAPDGRYANWIARDINNQGAVAGLACNINGGTAAFYWTAETGFVLLMRGTPDVTAMNDSGTITGLIGQGPLVEAYLWDPLPGTVHGLGVLPGETYSFGTDINDQGDLTGQIETTSGEFHPAFWSRTSGFVDLGVPVPGYDGQGNAINKRDEIVGIAANPQGVGGAAFYWSRPTGMVILPVNPDRRDVLPVGINNDGVIAGQGSGDHLPGQAILWKTYTESPRELGTLPGGTMSAALGINNHAQVVGWGDVPGEP